MPVILTLERGRLIDLGAHLPASLVYWASSSPVRDTASKSKQANKKAGLERWLGVVRGMYCSCREGT